MKFLLAALNAKYIHSNPGIYSLKAYAKKREAKFSASGSRKREVTIELGEYTINNRLGDILKDIYEKKPDMVGFSCYIWNISLVLELARDLPKILPGVEIWLGGPEVSYDAADILEKEPAVTGIMAGEGEETFTQVLDYYEGRRDCLWETAGVACRNDRGDIVVNPVKKAVDMSAIPFPYKDLTDFKHKIVYYESSRGCPFSCSYCLSSLDRSVRFRDGKLVKRELDFFLEQRIAQVKFIDRTFNCNKGHAIEIWRHILEQDNGVTNFHFEISADLLGEEELELMSRMRPGLIQLEIGVQSTNPDTLREIRRETDLSRLKSAVDRIHRFGNINCHLDLIAGLPFGDYDSFRNSFNGVYAMKPAQLQLGFLKVLKGSYMAENTEAYGLVYGSEPPYEVLGTRWLTYGSLLKLKGVEEMVEVYGNSGQFTVTMKKLVKEFETPFDFFLSLWEYYNDRGLGEISHSRMARYELLDRFTAANFPERAEVYRRLLTYDLYLRENIKSRPCFAEDQSPFRDRVRRFFAKEALEHRFLTDGYEGYEARQLMKMAHIEVFAGRTAVLFDYKKRDPLSYNAKAHVLPGFCRN